MTYAKWLDHIQKEKELRSEAAANGTTTNGVPHVREATVGSFSTPPPDQSSEPVASLCAAESDPDEEEAPTPKRDPSFLPTVEYFHSGTNFSIGDISITPFTIPHDAADPCGFVFESRAEQVRMAIATDLGYMPPNVKAALLRIDVLLLESNHDLDMLKDGPYPWSVKQRVLSRVGHLSNHATAEFLARDYDGSATYIVLGHISESNNDPSLALIAAEHAIQGRATLLGNRLLVARQSTPLDPICL
jgi:phosphoribosyl 1,2-cyclic phosphodiesterase